MAREAAEVQPGEPEEGPGVVEQLRQAIRQSGQALNQLSQRCGVGRDRLSRFLRGERGLTLEAAEKVCRVLRLELSPLVPPFTPAADQSEAGPGERPSGQKTARRKKG
jgi:transcriptional regulator with XRE-family HTH domain